jgi:predicted 3-demethylubiquinone-9 3-methyltransferase (glyoxalase superfamily)
MANKNTICLWYDRNALDAARFYAETFPNSKVGAVMRAPATIPRQEGDVLTVEFTVAGIPCVGLNGGPQFKHDEAFSFQIATDDQAETDRCGTRSSETAVRKARAAGARTSGACRGRSRRAPSPMRSWTPIAQRPSVRSTR